MRGRLRPTVPTALAGSAVAVLVVLPTACNEDPELVETFTIDVRDGDDVDDLYARAIIRAVDLCTSDTGLVRARWRFDEDDVDEPVVRRYTSPGAGGEPEPQAVDCAAIPRNPDGSPRSLPTIPSPPDAAADPPAAETPSTVAPR